MNLIERLEAAAHSILPDAVALLVGADPGEEDLSHRYTAEALLALQCDLQRLRSLLDEGTFPPIGHARATLENNVLWLRLFDQGEAFTITLSPLAAMALASDLLGGAIAMQQREPFEPALEERIAEGEHEP
jgi:hypothetical protein